MANRGFEPTVIAFLLSRNNDGNSTLCVGSRSRIVKIDPLSQKQPKLNRAQESIPLFGEDAIEDLFIQRDGALRPLPSRRWRSVFA